MWRPKDWENIEPCDMCPNISRTTNCAVMCEPWQRYAHMEVGADAMLKAIWKLAEDSPTGTFTFDFNAINIYGGENDTERNRGQDKLPI